MSTGGPYFISTERRWVISTRGGRRMNWSRALMCGHLGRLLAPDEHVHHVNGDQLDDRIENLEVLSHSEHMRLHSTERAAADAGQWARLHDACIVCGGTESPHTSHGRCASCKAKQFRRDNPATCQRCGGRCRPRARLCRPCYFAVIRTPSGTEAATPQETLYPRPSTTRARARARKAA